MIIALYILLALSIAAPIYTYAVYPFVIKLFRRKEYISDSSYSPRLSVVVFSDASNNDEKIHNLNNCDYPSEQLCISVVHNISELNKLVSESASELMLFTDAETEFDKNAVSALVSRFADDRIGCVCGLLRKKPDENGKPADGAFWMYENSVKRLESGIGRLSGANNAIYAVRTKILPYLNENIMNLGFYVSTYALQAGWDVVMAENAVAYEAAEKADGTNFDKHIRDGVGYFQALAVFWRMLFPRKGSFTYTSHRVMKWLVPFNLIAAFLITAVLMFESSLMAILFTLQTLMYLVVLLYYVSVARKNIKVNGVIGKLMMFAVYFMSVNIALLLGWLKYLFGRKTAVGS